VRGILGGTFDPPHLAHLVAAEMAFRQLALQGVTFLPAGVPWQKQAEHVSAAEHRLAMTHLAVADVDYFDVDDREVVRDGPTFTADTMDELGDERIVLILGADAALGLPTWHRSGEVLRRAQVAVIPRPGVERHRLEEIGGEFVWLDTPLLQISGTELRRRARLGHSLRFLVADPVWHYVEEHRLYHDA
jgi:nicotinate-nucleotide adenylyltransferase